MSGEYLRLVNGEFNFEPVDCDANGWGVALAEADLRTAQAWQELADEIEAMRADRAQVE